MYARFAVAYGWGASIREAQYEKVQKYSFANLDHFETSSLVTRMTTDVTVLQNAINGGFRPMVRGPGYADHGGGTFVLDEREACHRLSGLHAASGGDFFIVRKVAPMYTGCKKRWIV